MRIAVALITALQAAASPLAASAQAPPPIKIGFASAMSGPAAITGEGVRWGATLAVEEINAKGGVMGRKLEAYFADNKATPGEAVSASRMAVSCYPMTARSWLERVSVREPPRVISTASSTCTPPQPCS